MQGLGYSLLTVFKVTIYFRQFICGRSVVVLQVSCHLCQFELRLNHFAFVNILCSFIVMTPLSLRKSFALAQYTQQFIYICNVGYCSRKLTVSPNLNRHVYYENG